MKDTLSDDLIRIIREVNNGGTPLGPHLQARLAQRRNPPALERRELEVGVNDRISAVRVASRRGIVHLDGCG